MKLLNKICYAIKVTILVALCMVALIVVGTSLTLGLMKLISLFGVYPADALSMVTFGALVVPLVVVFVGAFKSNDGADCKLR